MPVKIYYAAETAVKFRPSAAGGAGVDIGLESLANGAGRISARTDLGASSKSPLYAWRGKFKLASTSTIDSAIELYLATSDGTLADGNFGTSDAAVADGNLRKNLQWMGSIVVDQTGTDVVLIGSGLVHLHERYVSLVVWNATDGTLTATAADHQVTLTPVPDEIQ